MIHTVMSSGHTIEVLVKNMCKSLHLTPPVKITWHESETHMLNENIIHLL